MPAAYTLKTDRYASHAFIAQQVQNRARNSLVHPYPVLDVGCAGGFLRPFLPKPDYYLMGVERDSDFAIQASMNYEEVYCLDIGKQPNFPIARKPELIVFGDILEHFAEPASILKAVLANNAQPGTRVVISLPNIAHLYVRLSLLLGRFNYADRGILDRTHLHFFTFKTACALCDQCGVKIESVSATPIPLPLLNPMFGEGQALFWLHRGNAALARTLKTIFAYQIILDGIYGTA